MAGARTLADIADELYALVPEEFTAARDAAARQARKDGASDLATELKQLRRPPVGAWLVNNLVRHDDGRLDELFELGAALREAQEALDGAELRAMSRQRHQLIRALSSVAVELAEQDDHRVADTAQREFENTLEAALSDEAAEQAVRTGRLMRPLASSGLEAVDLSSAVAAPDAAPPPRAPRAASRTRADRAATRPRTPPSGATGAAPGTPRATAPGRNDVRAERAAAQAERSARAALDNAASALAERESELAASREAVTDARNRVAELDAALAEARHQQAAAEQRRRDADQANRTAVRARDAAQRALDAATKKARH